MFQLAWGDATEDTLARFAASLRDSGAVESWRGARESRRYVCRVDGPIGAVRAAMANAGLDTLALLSFEQIGAWGASRANAEIANFVIRQVVPQARADIVTQLLDQANARDGALSRPGCLGLTLAAAVDAPETLLGVTFWSTIEDFDRYATWASTAPWKDVITPVTVDAPLRLLTVRHRGNAAG